MRIDILGLTLDIKIVGLLIIMVGFILLIIAALYKIIFKIERLKKEYKILEEEGMLDAAYTTSLDEELKNYKNTGEMPVRDVPKETKKHLKGKGSKTENDKPVRYADVDPGTGILHDDTEAAEYATSILDISQGETPEDSIVEPGNASGIEPEDKDKTSLMYEDEDKTSMM